MSPPSRRAAVAAAAKLLLFWPTPPWPSLAASYIPARQSASARQSAALPPRPPSVLSSRSNPGGQRRPALGLLHRCSPTLVSPPLPTAPSADPHRLPRSRLCPVTVPSTIPQHHVAASQHHAERRGPRSQHESLGGAAVRAFHPSVDAAVSHNRRSARVSERKPYRFVGAAAAPIAGQPLPAVSRQPRIVAAVELGE